MRSWYPDRIRINSLRVLSKSRLRSWESALPNAIDRGIWRWEDRGICWAWLCATNGSGEKSGGRFAKRHRRAARYSACERSCLSPDDWRLREGVSLPPGITLPWKWKHGWWERARESFAILLKTMRRRGCLKSLSAADRSCSGASEILSYFLC